MTERKKRGKPSKIDLLPEAIKAELDLLLRDGKLTQQAILEIVNSKVEAAGLTDNEKISKSGLNRYSTQMETIGADIRQAREISEMWISKLGTKPTGDTSQLLMEMLRTQLFKLMMKANEDPDELLDPSTINKLCLGIQRLEQASMVNLKREKEIRKEVAMQAAEEAETVAIAAGLTADAANTIKEQILGIA